MLCNRPHFAPPFVFLEILSGSGTLPVALRQKGAAVVSIDRRNSPSLDVTSLVVQRVVGGWAKGGCLACIWIAPPGDFAPQPRAVQIVDDLLALAHRRGTPAFVEGSRDARWWQEFPFSQDGCLWHAFDRCAWSGRFGHPSVILSWRASANLDLCRQCGGARSICNMTGRRHIQEFERDRHSGCLWKAIADARPRRLALGIASWFCASFVLFSGDAASELIGG